MPKVLAPQSDVVYRNAKPKPKPYLIADGGGLCLLVGPDGSKRWIFRYTFEGKERKISLLKNQYPAMSVKQARASVEAFREQLAAGEDPVAKRKTLKQQVVQELAEKEGEAKRVARTFEVVAREWLKVRQTEWSPKTLTIVQTGLEKNVLPYIGKLPITEITEAQVLSVFERVQARGSGEIARRTLEVCGRIFAFENLTPFSMKNLKERGLLPAVEEGHHAAIVDPEKFGQLLRAIDAPQGWISTRIALKLMPLVFTRSAELRLAEWKEFDFERAQWEIPASRMKLREPHIVPLPRQAMEMLQELRNFTGDGRLLFPSTRQKDKPISEAAMLSRLYSLGYQPGEVSIHGLRATARTLLDERLKVSPYLIEAQLSHKVPDALGRAYNRTQHLDARREMMQTWADYLDGLKGVK